MNKKYFFIILFSFIFCSYCYSKNKESYFIVLDSNKVSYFSKKDKALLDVALTKYHHSGSTLLQQLKSISYLTDNLNNLHWYDYNSWLINRCIHLLQKEKLTYKELYGIQRILAASYNNYGYQLTSQGLLDSALLYHKKSLSVNKKLKYLPGIAQGMNNIGFIYGEKGLTQLQIKYYNNSLKIRELLNDKKGIAISLNNIGFIYKSIKEYEEALKYFKQSLKISYEINDNKSTPAILNNIGLVYLQLENYKQAKYYLTESCSIRKKEHDEYGISMCYETIANIFEKQNFLDSAEYYYNLSLAIREKENDIKGIASSYFMLGRLNYIKSLNYKSIPLLISSLEKSKAINNSSLILNNSKLLSEIYKKEGDFRKSLEMHSLYSSINDSITQNSISEELKKQKNIAELEKINSIHKMNSKYKDLLIQKTNRDFIIVLSILITSVIIFTILIILLRKKISTIKNHQKELNLKNELLIDLNTKQSALLTNRDTLLKEIHHRVKNNLQVVTSLLALQSSFIKDDKIKRVFRYTQYRINSMAMVHEMLYQTEDLSKIDLKKYILKLSNNLVKSMKGSNNNIELDVEIPHLFLNVDTVIPLGLLINEILTNSLKYGVNDESCRIYIKIIHLEKNNFVMYIGDNGVGFDDQTSFRSSNSLGLILIHNLTLQLQGSIEKNNNLNGTNYIITFKENLTSLKNYEENINSRR